jgi:soluble cytochrome b562
VDLLNLAIEYIVVPICAAVLLIYNKINAHHTDIEVLKATAAANKEAHDREFKEVKESFKAVMEKLDNIEQHLRK